MSRIVALFLLAPSVALSADIYVNVPSVAGQPGNFSTPSIWSGGVAPGPGDVAHNQFVSGRAWYLTYDAAAPASLAGYDGASQGSLTLMRDLHVTGNVTYREGYIYDNGFDLTVDGTLANTYWNGSEWNGGSLVRQGGNLYVNAFSVGRNNFIADPYHRFRPGDVVSGVFSSHYFRNTAPKIEVEQDPTYYSDRLDQGLTLESASSGQFVLDGGTQFYLTWDPGFQGAIDWTLRKRGNHVDAFTIHYNAGRILIDTVPAGETFDPAENIFYNADDDYTYIGFQSSDIDGDGIPNSSDVCPEDPYKGVGAGFCGCSFFDLDMDDDGSAETCVHITADVDETVTLEPGALILADAVVAPRATIGSTGQVGVGSVVGRRSVIDGTVGDDVTISRSVSIGAGSTIGNGASLGYASTIVDADIGPFAVLGALSSVGSSTTIGAYTVIARGGSVGDSCNLGANVVIGPDSTLGDTCALDDFVRLRKEVQVGDNVTIGLRARVGRSVTIGAVSGAASTVGEDVQIRANADVPAGYCVADDVVIERGVTVDTACN